VELLTRKKAISLVGLGDKNLCHYFLRLLGVGEDRLNVW
jgi:hypothetical protein